MCTCGVCNESCSLSLFDFRARSFLLSRAIQDFIDDPPILRLFRGEMFISIDRFSDQFNVLIAIFSDNLVDFLANCQQLSAFVLDVRSGASRHAGRVMQHHSRVWQRRAHTFLAVREQQTTHRSRASKCHRSNFTLRVVHGVHNRHRRHDLPAFRVDV